MSVVDLIDPRQLARISRDVYVRMIEEGMLAEDARVQLLEGVLVEMSPQGPTHTITSMRVSRALQTRLRDRADVVMHSPIEAGTHSQPEPDVAVWPFEEQRTDVPDRVWLVVEVAVTSLRDDRLVMAPIYAAAGVPEYWIVNVVGDVVERHTRPEPKGYAQVETLRRGDEIRLVSLPDVVVPVTELLPVR